MSRTTVYDALFRTPTSKQKFIYWQTVPLRRLIPLLLAIFCLFGMVSFIIDLFSLGQKPIPTVVIWTLFTGMIAIAYALVITRRPRYILIPVAVHLLGSRIIAHIHHQFHGFVHPSIEYGVQFSATAVLVLSMLACLFFFLFIQGEGLHSVRIQTELALAHRIQKTLVPVIDKQFPRFEIYGVSEPSEEVGGDLVDAVVLRDQSVFTYIADVAGHGLSAGILMGMVKTAVRTQLLDGASLTAVFERLNEVLPQVKEANMYATGTALHIGKGDTLGSLDVEYAIAAQPSMLHLSAATRTVSRISDEQLPLGLLPGPGSYQSRSLHCEPDDVLLIVTDGILEAEDKGGEPFGYERLERLLLEHRNAALPAVAGKIQDELRHSYQRSDDQTLLLIRFGSKMEA